MDAAYTTEQNKIASAGAWICLLELATTGYSTLYYTNDNAKPGATEHYYTTWNGHQYWSVPFSMDDLSVSTSGKFPEYKLQIGDVDPVSDLRTRIKATGGMVGSTVRFMIVHSDHLALTTPAIDETAEILGCELTVNAIVFTIGIPSLLSRRFPRDKYVPGFCRHKFGGALCNYSTATAIYKLTSNQISFITGVAGTPGIRYNTIQAAGGGLINNVFSHAPGQRSCVGNLIQNGGFEEGALGSRPGWTGGYADHWDVWGSPSVKRRWDDTKSISTIAKYDTHSFYCASEETNGGIYQTVSGLTTGLSYTLSCWVFVNGAHPNVSLRMMVLKKENVGDNYVSVKPTHVNQWERLTLTVAPWPKDYGELTVYLGGLGWAWWDGLCMVQGSVASDFDHYQLDASVGVVITGSQRNDGNFFANSYHDIGDTYVRVLTEADHGGAFVGESAGNTITIGLRYGSCDHTLKACALRDNTQNFGGSPGIRGGAYG